MAQGPNGCLGLSPKARVRVREKGLVDTGSLGIFGMNCPCYVGIDVSKDGLDVAARPGGEVFSCANSAAGLRKLLRRLAALTVALICMEATGGYERKLAAALAKHDYPVAIVNPRRMRRYLTTSIVVIASDANQIA